MRSLLSPIRNAPWPRRAFTSQSYGERRHRLDGASGPDFCSNLTEFRLEVLNDLAQPHAIGSVIEFGCGDGNHLGVTHYHQYVGYYVSRAAVETTSIALTATRQSSSSWPPNTMVAAQAWHCR
jgi:hypothetical protein